MTIARTMISQNIRAFHGRIENEHHRYRSWEHCYSFFQTASRNTMAINRDVAALQLGFYLASWGMYRGSSFLLQHAYTIHLRVIDQVLAPKFAILWEQEFGLGENDAELIPIILNAFAAIREAYRPFAYPSEERQASDTLVTKILLGTFGCMPACDRYFINGFKNGGNRYSYVNRNFLERLQEFCLENIGELQHERERIADISGMQYPIMKLVDMYFWEEGFECSLRSRSERPI